MSEYIPTICFVAGLVAGVVVTAYGFKLGFKASYEIREARGEDVADKGLLGGAKDPAEFELLGKPKE